MKLPGPSGPLQSACNIPRRIIAEEWTRARGQLLRRWLWPVDGDWGRGRHLAVNVSWNDAKS